MKRVILLAVLIAVLAQPTLHAQERDPLAMRIAFEWTGAGGLLGAVVGFALWLTDPGNPNIRLGDQMARGASLGIIAGAAYSLFILQRSAQLPVQPLAEVRDPLDPAYRLTTDPIASIGGETTPLALITQPGSGGGGVMLPLFHIRF